MKRSVLAALCTVVLGSCGEGTSPSATSALSTALAQYTAAEPFLPTGLFRANATEVGPFGVVPAPCLYSAASSSFVCAEITSAGVSVSRSYQLLDAGAQPLSVFDASTVAAIRIVSTASGVVTVTGALASTTSYTSSADHTYGGLITGPREINGQTTTVATFTKNGKTTNTTSVLAVDRIAPPLTAAAVAASDGFGFPMSGKVTSAVTGTDTLGVGFTAQVETTFNGTATIVTAVARSGVTVTYTCTYARGSANTVFVTCTTS